MPRGTPNFTASGDINPSRFVTISGDHEVAESNANEKIIGISQEGSKEAPIPSNSTLAAADGDTLLVYGQGEECLLELGGTCDAGEDLKSDADGKGVIVTAGTGRQEVGATALEAGVSGDKIRVVVNYGGEGDAEAS